MTTIPAERLPPIPEAQWSEEQKKAVAQVVAGPRGKLVGPFFALMRSPEFMMRASALGEYLRFRCVLGEKLKELAILVTARHWSQQFEFFAHKPFALKAGLAPAIVDAIADGRRPDQMDGDETTVHDFVVELLRSSMSVSDATFEKAKGRFGEQGVVEMTGVVGYYTLVASILNVARVPLPAGEPPSLRPFPR